MKLKFPLLIREDGSRWVAIAAGWSPERDRVTMHLVCEDGRRAEYTVSAEKYRSLPLAHFELVLLEERENSNDIRERS